MKKSLRWLLRVGGAVVLLLAGAVLFRNGLIKAGVEAAVTRATGFPLSIGSFDLGLTASRIEIRDMTLTNPEGFPDPRCLRIPEVVVDVEASTLSSERLHIQEMVLDVEEVVVVRTADGATNIDRLRAVGGKGREDGKGAPPVGEGKEKPLAWQCDRLELTIGRVVLVDYSLAPKGKPRVETWDIGVDHEEFRDIDGPDKIVRLIVLRVLQETRVTLVTTTVETLAGGLGGVVNAAGGLVGGAASAVEKGLKGIGGHTKSADDAIKDLLGGGR